MSIDFHHSILVPVDFSKDCLAAVNLAIVFGKALKCNVKLLHVIHSPSTDPDLYHQGKAGKKVLQHLDEVAQDLMKEFVKKHDLAAVAAKAGVTLDSACILGKPVESIIQEVSSGQHGLIVMGSSGKTGLSHLLLGSVAERVIQLSPIPVTVAKRGS